MDQQAKSERGQDTQPEGGGQGLGTAQQVLGRGAVLRQQLPVLSLTEVGALLGLAAVVAILAGCEVLDEQDAVGALVARLAALLHVLLVAPGVCGVTGLHGAAQVVTRVPSQGNLLQGGLVWRGMGEAAVRRGPRAPEAAMFSPADQASRANASK